MKPTSASGRNGGPWTPLAHHWRNLSKEPERTPVALADETVVDFAVVGAGFTGLSAAMRLAGEGMSTAVVEQHEVGWGASGRNNGQVIPHHSRALPNEIVERLGRRHGEAYNELVGGVAQALFDFVREHRIACDPQQNGWVQAAHSAGTAERARAAGIQWRDRGAAAAPLSGLDVSDLTGASGYLGGWTAASGGHVNPWALAQGMARILVASGGKVFEHTPVTRLTRHSRGWELKTPRTSILARRVLVATNGLTGSFWPGLNRAMIPVRVFQVATAPLGESGKRVLPRNLAMSDTRRDIRAYRRDSSGGIVTGGTHTHWLAASRRGKAKALRHLARTFPDMGEVAARDYWEGVLAVVPDRLPRIMRLDRDGLFVGLYSGRGVAMSLALGRLAATLLLDRTSEGELPLEVTPVSSVPAHYIAVQAAKLVHPLHRILDRLK